MSEPCESPWIRRYPQLGFWLARRMTRRRSSGSIGGRPVFGVGGWVQCRATSRRCHRSTVSGRTIRNVVARRVRSMVLLSRARIVRSVSMNLGWSIWRCSTRIWCRSARISASRESPLAKTQPILVRTRRASEGSRSTRRRRYRPRGPPRILRIKGRMTSRHANPGGTVRYTA